jgi:ABC-2 type transport system permease protein
MFYPIFKEEIKHWSKKANVYVFGLVFLVLGMLISSAVAGIFSFVTVMNSTTSKVNSPIYINSLFNGVYILLNFIIPSVVGVSIYRDYKSQMHTILYSYPFTKWQYLSAKFMSSFLVTLVIALLIGIGMFIGYRLPGTNGDIVSDFNFLSYLSTYLVYIIPNIFFISVLVFSIVTFTRNIAAGFITVLVLIILRSFITSFGSNPDYEFIIGLLDPFGESTVSLITKGWTIQDQNTLQLPVIGVVIYNRLIWIGVSLLIFIATYFKFSFSQNAIKLSFKKQDGERVIKENFKNTKKITLPSVRFDYSFKTNLKAAWQLSKADFNYIFNSWPFRIILIIGLLALYGGATNAGEMYETSTFPTTWLMLRNGVGVFGLFINILTFLYAGLIIHRSRVYKIADIENSTPLPNWVFILSKFYALLKMQIILLSFVAIIGILYQLISGYTDLEIGHYIFELYGLRLIHFIVWTLLAIFIQTMFRNPYLGFFILLLISMGMNYVGFIGIEQDIYKYNNGSGFTFSDLNGYGDTLTRYFAFKFYWLFLGLFLVILASLFWVRGIFFSAKERIKIAKSRTMKLHYALSILFLVGFVTLGSSLYYADNVFVERTSAKESEKLQVEWEKKYKKYENKVQPRITAVNVAMGIYPDDRTYKAKAHYFMVNKSNENITELYLNHNDLVSTFKFNKEVVLTMEDTVQNFDIYTLSSPLQPGEKLELEILVENKKNHWLNKQSPVVENGTFINNFAMFPSFGYSSDGELTDDGVRASYGLPKNDLKPHPSDSSALGNTYISHDSDWIDFEATVSTKEGQVAIAPGSLVKDWKENGRHYFTYRMSSKILHFYAFNSGKYDVHKDKWKDVDIEIYHYTKHKYNLEDMVAGVKASLDYNSKYFSPYQHKVVRIIEFPKTAGSFAQSFPNTIPFSESIGFIANNDSTDEVGVNYCFAVTVHELAHQWWAHQVIGADVLGATMLSESLSEYVALQVLKHEHGAHKMRKFLKHSLNTYLRGRKGERKRENALMYNDGQGYIRYQKGSLIFYALSDYLGEEVLNSALKRYVEKVKFQSPPYTTSIEMVDYIKEVTPDSFQYLIHDMFETITLYDNKVNEVEVLELDNGKYQLDIELQVRKYKDDEKGKHYFGADSIQYEPIVGEPITSEKLNDYLDVGVFGKDENGEEKVLYLQRRYFDAIHNKIQIIVDEKPIEVGIDPYCKLIDTWTRDNRKEVK